MDGHSRQRGVLARTGAWLASGLLIVLLGLVLSETGLQLAAFFAAGRGGVWREGATHRILCIGDSHTYGAGVEREKAYPAQLQRLLDEREPGVHSVLNLGLPGLNTAQVRNRIAHWVQRYRPDLLIVWVGVNNAWNHAELDSDNTETSRLEGLLTRSRLYRLIRVRLHDRGLDRYTPKDGDERRWHVAEVENPFLRHESYTVHHDGIVERVEHLRHEYLESAPDERAPRVQARIERDLGALAEFAEAAGIPLILVTYPLEASWPLVANRAARSAAERHDLALVESVVPVLRVPEPARARDWRWAVTRVPSCIGRSPPRSFPWRPQARAAICGRSSLPRPTSSAGRPWRVSSTERPGSFRRTPRLADVSR